MKFLEIYKTLHHHQKLADERHPMYYANRSAKFMTWFFTIFFLLYLVFFAVMFSLIVNNNVGSVTAIEFMVGITPFILALDFGARFLMQQTPSQLIKPYVLLPLPKYACVDCFILSSLLSWGNLTWMVMLMPYCLMSVCFGLGFLPALSMLVLFYILELANSQWYAIVRTMVNRKAWWWALPVVVYGIIALPWIIKDIEEFLDFYASFGSGIEYGNILPHLGALVVLVVLTAINRKVQYVSVMEELGKQKVTKMKTVTRLSFLSQFGEIGEYLKLEARSLMRNKNPRKSFISSIIGIIVISGIIFYTDVYDGNGMAGFWCLYNYIIIAIGILPQVMAYEGNYLNFLMVHKENLLKLFTAKYYFGCALAILPFLLMLPMVFEGRWSILMLFAYAAFVMGPVYCLMLQMAVINKTTQPLNEKFTGRAGSKNYIQMIAAMSIFFLPVVFVSVLNAVCSQTAAWSILFGLGVLFIATHRLWLRNIYNRWMKHRYENMMALAQ